MLTVRFQRVKDRVRLGKSDAGQPDPESVRQRLDDRCAGLAADEGRGDRLGGQSGHRLTATEVDRVEHWLLVEDHPAPEGIAGPNWRLFKSEQLRFPPSGRVSRQSWPEDKGD